MSNALYTAGLVELGKGTDDYENGDVRILLVDSGYVFDADHKVLTDFNLGANELSGTGYGRQPLTGQVVTQDDALDLALFDADDVLWSAITTAQPAAAAILFFFKTGDVDSVPIAFIDEGGFPASLGGGDLELVWAATGIIGL